MADTFNTTEYWENRYHTGGTSGEGSYGKNCIDKTSYINQTIDKYNIQTINDLGHGDGNQIANINIRSSYTGYDVSSSARYTCISKYKDNAAYTFIDSLTRFNKADLVMSLDVIYHIIEFSVWSQYMIDLFSLSDLILIYSPDKESKGDAHYHSRKFTPYIADHFPQYNLIATTKDLSKDLSKDSSKTAKFYLYGNSSKYKSEL